MKQVTIENVKARIAELEGADRIIGLGLHAEFELACLKMLLTAMHSRHSPFFAGVDPDMSNAACLREINEVLGMSDITMFSQVATAINDMKSEIAERLRIAEGDRDKNGWYVHECARLEREIESAATVTFPVIPDYVFHVVATRWPLTADQIKRLYQELQPAVPANSRAGVRTDHAEWSQATFGNVGPIGPLKHLAKEAMEAAAAPGDLSEWADMQFLLWDAQRRAGITDEQITQAMIDKLAVNKARQWPEPKDGEPRLHIQADNDNTAQQFEALATSAQPEIIGYESRVICGEPRRVPKFAGQDIEATSAESGKQ